MYSGHCGEDYAFSCEKGEILTFMSEKRHSCGGACPRGYPARCARRPPSRSAHKNFQTPFSSPRPSRSSALTPAALNFTSLRLFQGGAVPRGSRGGVSSEEGYEEDEAAAPGEDKGETGHEGEAHHEADPPSPSDGRTRQPDARCASTRHVCRSLRSRFGTGWTRDELGPQRIQFF